MASISLLSISPSLLPSIHQLPNDQSYPFHPIQSYKSNLLRLCSQGHLEEASKLLIQLENNRSSDFPLDSFTYNNLLSAYGKQGRLEEALNLFDKMPERNEISWSTIISAYTRCRYFSQALDLFVLMLEEGCSPNEFALGSLLKGSSGLREIFIGRQLHGWSIRAGFGLDVVVQTSLITMYSYCGFLDDALRVFSKVPICSLDDVPLWNSIIAAYVFHECWVEAFRLFVTMISMGLVVPTERSYTTVINACANARAEKYGKMIHGRIIKDGLFDATMMGNSLITFYVKCGNLDDANRLFERISRKSVVSWNAIISGNEQNGEHETAKGLFHRMLRVGQWMQPNRITFLSVLSAVYGVSDLMHGREIHAHLIRSGLELDTSIGNSLITMYSKCREVNKARTVFLRLPLKDLVTWNSMLAGYEQNGQLESCLKLFRKMSSSGIEPDAHSFTVILSAISSEWKYLRAGREVHSYILRRAASGNVGISTCNAILSMYAKCNQLADAEKIFKGMHERDSYSWNAMMDGYSLNGRSDDTIMIFLDMQEQGLLSDHLTFSILLTACGRLVSFQLGKQFHAFIVKQISHFHIHQTSMLSINNALISMYSKCGSISDAARVFSRMRRKDVFSWTAMITGYAHHGMAFESLQLFEKMKQDAVKPNAVTFLGLLIACAHAGFLEEGTHYFSSMCKDHGLKPSIEHYACLVDLFGRLGQIEQAEALVKNGVTLFSPNHGDCLSLWKVLLGACHAHNKLEIGVHAAMKIFESEPEDETTHILLSNLYAASGMWEDAIRVRGWMRTKGLKKKEVGCSWIEAANRRHVFVAGDVSHPQRKDIYMKLEDVDKGCRGLGYVPMTELVLHDVDDSQKEVIIGCHSEKLALSFGLLQSGPGSKGVIRVIKNLRVCGDCHNWMKFVSEVERREIVLRDSRRFHFFKNGTCSCGDYW